MHTINTLFTKIYSAYYNDVFRLAYSYTLSIEDAEDILQYTFTKLYKNISKFEEANEDVKKWLFKVTSNHSKNHLKLAWNKKKNLNIDLENFGIKKEESDLFYLLEDLTSKYRFPLYFYYYEGYSIKEISKILKISESATKQRLKRGKEKLKKEMEKANERKIQKKF